VGIGIAGQNVAISINIPGFSVDKKFKLIILYNRIKFYIIERKERRRESMECQALGGKVPVRA
jgi:hypothetical protein